MRINVTRSSMPPMEEYAEEIRSLWDSHWLTNNGEKLKKLEAALKQRLLENSNLETVYDQFCGELELRLRSLDGPDSDDCPPVLAAAVRGVACKIRVEQLLGEQKGADGT